MYLLIYRSALLYRTGNLLLLNNTLEKHEVCCLRLLYTIINSSTIWYSSQYLYIIILPCNCEYDIECFVDDYICYIFILGTPHTMPTSSFCSTLCNL